MSNETKPPALPGEVWRGEVPGDDDATILTAVTIVDGAASPMFYAFRRWREPARDFGYQILTAWAMAESARAEKVEAFARDCRDNWDCDEDAHRYGTTCRACEAKRVLGGES